MHHPVDSSSLIGSLVWLASPTMLAMPFFQPLMALPDYSPGVAFDAAIILALRGISVALWGADVQLPRRLLHWYPSVHQLIYHMQAVVPSGTFAVKDHILLYVDAVGLPSPKPMAAIMVILPNGWRYVFRRALISCNQQGAELQGVVWTLAIEAAIRAGDFVGMPFVHPSCSAIFLPDNSAALSSVCHPTVRSKANARAYCLRTYVMQVLRHRCPLLSSPMGTHQPGGDLHCSDLFVRDLEALPQAFPGSMKPVTLPKVPVLSAFPDKHILQSPFCKCRSNHPLFPWHTKPCPGSIHPHHLTGNMNQPHQWARWHTPVFPHTWYA